MEHLQPAVILQPMEVPTTVPADVDMEFVEGPQRVNGKSVILSVIDRFSKYCHFLPLGHSYTTKLAAHLFFNNVVKLHGIPSSIVSNWDAMFDHWKFLVGALQIGWGQAAYVLCLIPNQMSSRRRPPRLLRCTAGPCTWIQ
jgi:hypothetical protein